jgi:uncharacterized cupin superfamily protein
MLFAEQGESAPADKAGRASSAADASVPGTAMAVRGGLCGGRYRCPVEHVAHWDEVEPARREAGHIGGTWRDLGRAAGSRGVGVKLVDVDPGKWSTPAHVEGAEEEIFFVLAGSGLSWQGDLDGCTVHEVRAGDCLVHLAEAVAHTLRAGPEGLRVLAYGQRLPHGNTVLPRAGVAWMWPAFAAVTVIGEERHPYRREAEAGEPDVGELSERPPTTANLEDVTAEAEDRPGYECVERDLARAGGSVATGLRHVVLEPGRLNCPPHCHSAEEEIFVVLDGDGTLLLGDDEAPVRAGSVVARPPGTRVAHALRAGDGGLTYLAYGTREPNDIAYYPRSGKVFFRGIGLMTRLEHLDYWDGEP